MIVIKYAGFALLATLINVLFQYFSLSAYSGLHSLYLAMAVGTLAGLVTKYVLDKKFIFYHKVENKRQDATRFFFYSLTGVFTTFIFWGTEIAFNALFEYDAAKYIGAIIGLAIGYLIKYRLDKTYVFREQSV